MALTSIDIIALVLSVLVLAKVTIILIDKKWWIEKVFRKFYKKPDVAGPSLAITGLVIFYFLIQNLSMAQIFAVIAFCGVLMGLAFLPYFKELTNLVDKISREKLSSWMWTYILIWIVLSLWTLYDVFS